MGKQFIRKVDPYFIGLDNSNPQTVILGAAFKSAVADINDATLHYIYGGSGKAIIFIHGFSQDWYEFSKLLPLLVKDYSVIAVDLRGIGESKSKSDSYDAETLAKDIHQLAQQLNIKLPYIVGHDMGGMVAYAYARLYPNETGGVAILDAPLPGTPSTDLMVKIPILWHFGFHRIPKLPEVLISGREFTYFKKAFFNRFAKNKQAITDTTAQHYASAYKNREQLKAGLGLYRTYRQNQLFMKSHSEKLKVPILLIESDYGSSEPGPTAEELKVFGCQNVTSTLVKDCGHFMSQENPEAISNLLRNHLQTL